jgi:hypothetical protein
LFPHSGTFGFSGFLEDFPGGFRMCDRLQTTSRILARQARVPQSASFSVAVPDLTRDLQLVIVTLDRTAGFSEPGPRFPHVVKDHCLSTAVVQVTDKVQ